MKSVMWKPSAAVQAALTAEDVCRMALSAYYAAAKGEDLGPLDASGDPWEPGDEVMPGEEFATLIEGHFVARLAVHERKSGFGERTSVMNVERIIRALDPAFYGPELNGLPPSENAGKNSSERGLPA